jgi:3-oxoacyl-[acyl-carrier protein] reductase
MSTLQNKTALVTGASRGIGRARQRHLLGPGHTFWFSRESLVSEIQAQGGRAKAISVLRC